LDDFQLLLFMLMHPAPHQQRCCAAWLQAVLDRYRALLHEYRQHKQSLGDWLGAFMSSCRRPPQLLDVQATGDPELLAR
jgi:ribosomal protein L16 Arg81 hydroxylase